MIMVHTYINTKTNHINKDLQSRDLVNLLLSSTLQDLTGIKLRTVEPVYYGDLGTNHKCPDYQGVLSFYMIKHHWDHN